MVYCVTDVNRLRVNIHLRSYCEVDIIAKFFTIKNWRITYVYFLVGNYVVLGNEMKQCFFIVVKETKLRKRPNNELFYSHERIVLYSSSNFVKKEIKVRSRTTI